MITLFELKNRGVCKYFIRTPFYIKNFVLLLQLAFLLAVIYLVYFRKDGLVIQNISKILKGLNSETFNYLGSNADSLRPTKLLNNYKAEISPTQFMSDCLRINKPCKFEGLAKNWTAFKAWQFDEEKGYEYLLEKWGNEIIFVYKILQEDFDDVKATTDGDSFKLSRLTPMSYKDFITKMSKDDSADYNLRHGGNATMKFFRDEVENPQFMAAFNRIKEIEVLQGQQFVMRPHYERDEQLLCSIDGTLQVKLIPHIYRQELYTGKDKVILEEKPVEGPANIKLEHVTEYQSPIDFFDPDIATYPLFEDIDRKYTVLLHEGDCMYVPAFFFHQYVAKTESQPAVEGMKPSTIAVSLHYKGNSLLLDSFMTAVEGRFIT